MTTPAIIWDVDGTLLDSAEQHYAAWHATVTEGFGKPYTRADFARTFGWRNPEIIRHLIGPATDAECAAIGLRKETLYRESVRRDGVSLLPGVPALLATFAERGWPQAVGSSAPRGNLDLLLAATDTLRYFAAVVSGDDVSRGKPEPEVFLTAATKLGADPRRCVVFEDAPAGVEAAKAAGMVCVAVCSHHPAAAFAAADWVVGELTEVTAERVERLVS